MLLHIHLAKCLFITDYAILDILDYFRIGSKKKLGQGFQTVGCPAAQLDCVQPCSVRETCVFFLPDQAKHSPASFYLFFISSVVQIQDEQTVSVRVRLYMFQALHPQYDILTSQPCHCSTKAPMGQRQAVPIFDPRAFICLPLIQIAPHPTLSLCYSSEQEIEVW